MKYYLGADVGSSKTQILIADEKGKAAGLGFAGPGNHQTVGYEGMFSALQEGLTHSLDEAGISVNDISGAGFGISGYDWPSDKPRMIEVITRLGLQAPLEMYNDAVLGLVAGAEDGWGIAVVSGTGCNCWGWASDRDQIGRVTDFEDLTGEAAGSTELVYRAMQLVAQAWTKRGQETALTQGLIDYAGVKSCSLPPMGGQTVSNLPQPEVDQSGLPGISCHHPVLPNLHSNHWRVIRAQTTPLLAHSNESGINPH